MRPIGEKGSPDQPAMWEMPVKSFVTLPTEQTPVVAGKFRVTGVAFGGTKPVAKVEVSTDGKRWHEARWVGPDLGRYAWRVFELELEREPGPVKLYSRATNAAGEVQPEYRNENERGYGNNSWRDMGVTVQVCTADDAVCLTPPPEVERSAARATQAGRSIRGRQARPRRSSRDQGDAPLLYLPHALATPRQLRRSARTSTSIGRSFQQVKAAVTNGVGAMPPFGQTLTPAQIEDVARYVYEATRWD